MDNSSALLVATPALPAACAGLALLMPSPRAVLAFAAAVVTATLIVALAAARVVFASAMPIEAAGGWLFADALSAWHLVVLLVVFTMSTFFAWSYFGREQSVGAFRLHAARRFGALWLASLASMAFVLVSNNLGLLWVGIEATTLVTAFLICVHVTPYSLEAMWKYLIMCSVGVAFAFLGTLLVGLAAARAGSPAADALLWTRLSEHASSLDAATVKAAFLFLLVGYGTKAGLAPLHNWLPDAHSQAPAPVSAVFSGFLLNTALYCIFRYVPIVEAATGRQGWALSLLLLFGIVSIAVAAAFILMQHDAKRLLAYHSVEHMGIIVLGVGLGGIGMFAALFHTLNHSLCKALAFFSVGRLGQMYGTHDMRKMAGAMRAAPLYGAALLASLLALIGVAPFALFMSEFQIVKAAADARAWVALVLFLAGTSVVFVAALRHAIEVVWGRPTQTPVPVRSTFVDALVVLFPLAALLFLGLWMPATIHDALRQAAAVLAGGI